MPEPSEYMQRALELAALGREWVAPNPMVGCVIVKDDLIVGEGFHQAFGEAHAEVNAINSLKDATLMQDCDVYVTLEPCSHTGKTPPCADLLIKHMPKRVYVCNSDPNPLVSGRGIAKLRAAGIEVEVGLLQEEGEVLNRRFFKSMLEKMPYIIIKWAESADGYVSAEGGEPIKITNEISDFNVHRWRAEESAIMVGSRTVKSDDPKLNNRLWPEGKDPLRVVVDRNLNLGPDYHVFSDGKPTVVLNCIKESEAIEKDFYDRNKETKNDNVVFLKAENNSEFLRNSFEKLVEMGINSVLVEAGPTLAKALFEVGLYDEIRLLKSDIILKKGIAAPNVPAGIPLVGTTSFLKDTYYKYCR